MSAQWREGEVTVPAPGTDSRREKSGLPWRARLSFSARVTLVFALLLLGFSLTVAILGRHLAQQYELEMQQRLSLGLARHIVDNWPQVAMPAQGDVDRRALGEVLHMLMVVNPAIEVYILDENGRVRDYLGEPDSVRQQQVDIDAVRAFLAGAPLPLVGSDPKSPGGKKKIFSAAMFPESPGTGLPSGYLYVVLDGEARTRVAGSLDAWRPWRTAVAMTLAGLILTLFIGWMIFITLTRPLRHLAERMGRFGLDGEARPTTGTAAVVSADEVGEISQSFDRMAQRLAQQARDKAAQQAAHREVMASVAHDLRTPLTALHGYLETLHRESNALPAPERHRYLEAALAQSNKVRRLSQQLFELARLQSVDHVPQRERFSLDELVNDALQKFALTAQPPSVIWRGPSPGRIEMEGDLQLIDRALTNLIDNALLHAPRAGPVRVSLRHEGRHAMLLVEDGGPGLPDAIRQRLDANQPVRDPPVRREGGFGGLGLAIAQRIAWLHGGRLRTLPSRSGGARLCLALPTLTKGASGSASHHIGPDSAPAR